MAARSNAPRAGARHGWGRGRGRLALALLGALALLTGALNVRAVFGDGDDAAWRVDPAASSAIDRLVGAPDRAPTDLDAQILALQDVLRDDGEDGRAATLLGQAYLQKARETGDPSYYPKAETLFALALAEDGGNAEALTGRGALALARHRFAEALDWGERARAAGPYHAPAHGVVVDALVELGRDAEAVAAAQAMVDLRPDLASFARVSYVRELHGDRAGAIQAMEQAAEAGSARAENVAWTQTQLGNLRFDGGDLDGAARHFAHALAVLPGYPYGLAGQGRVAAARGDFERAIALYDEAVVRLPATEFVIALGDLYRAAGRPEEAAAQDALVDAMRRLQAENGVDTDLEMALFDADRNRDPAGTVARAREQVAQRPSVVAYDVLAWALFRSGDLNEAREASRQALRLGTQDAVMHFHAGMIEAALGDRAAAATHLQTALDLNPHFSLRYAAEARATLAALRNGTETTS